MLHGGVLSGQFFDGDILGFVVGQPQIVDGLQQAFFGLLKVVDGLVDVLDGILKLSGRQIVVPSKASLEGVQLILEV